MPSNNTGHTVVAVHTKSPVLAFILALVLGPLGFLYVSILGGLLLLVLYAGIFLVTLGFSTFLVPFANVVLAVIAALMAMARNSGEMRRAQARVADVRVAE